MNVQQSAIAVAALALLLAPSALHAADGHGHHNWSATTRVTALSAKHDPSGKMAWTETCFTERRWVTAPSGERVRVIARVCY